MCVHTCYVAAYRIAVTLQVTALQAKRASRPSRRKCRPAF